MSRLWNGSAHYAAILALGVLLLLSVVLDVDLLLTPQSVMTGGLDTGSEFWGNADYTLNVDTGKLGLWPGGFLNLSADSGFGHNVFTDSASIMPVNTPALVPAPGHETTALTNATFMQFLSTNFGLLIGKVYTLDGFQGEFAGNYRTQFLNTGLVIPAAMDLVPISAFGGGVIVIPWENVLMSALLLDPSSTPTLTRKPADPRRHRPLARSRAMRDNRGPTATEDRRGA